METRLEFYEHFFIENLINPQKLGTIINDIVVTNKLEVAIPERCEAETLYAILSENVILRNLNVDFFCRLLHDSGNLLLAKVMSIDPDLVTVGSINWEKIIYDWWQDFSGQLDFELLVKIMMHEKILKNSEAEWIARNLQTNDGRVGMAICLYAEKVADVDVLQRILYNIGISQRQVMLLAHKCTPTIPAEYEHLLWHRDFFIMSPPNLHAIVEHFRRQNVLTNADVLRFERMTSQTTRAKYLINTLQRKSVPIIESLIDVLVVTDFTDMAVILKFQPSQIDIPWNAFQLLQQNWLEIVNTVRYEDVMGYLVSRDFLPYKLHLKIKNLANNADKMRQILRLAVASEDFYDALFHTLGLQPQYGPLFQDCVPMNFEAKKIILETQDFLAQNIENFQTVIIEMAKDGLVTPSDTELIKRMPTKIKRNLTICNVLKKKSMSAIRKFVDVLWRTRNRDCSEMLAIDFQNFHLGLEEWNKLKSNWRYIIHSVKWNTLWPTLLGLEVLSQAEKDWVEKSEKNRSRMRKLLRILPSKAKGYSSLLMAMSQYDEYVPLLIQSQPIDYWQLKSFQDNMEFLIDNTSDLHSLLSALKVDGVITDAECELLSCYEEPIQELYMLLVGKNNDVVDRLVVALQKSGHYNAAAVMSIDLSSIKMSTSEWLDYQRMWLDFIDELAYMSIREILLSLRLTNEFEDDKIRNQPDNTCQMRMLLQILPYRYGAFSALVQLML